MNGKVFIGVITSRRGSSNSIRNSQLLNDLNERDFDIKILDFGLVFSPEYKIIKLLNLIYLSFKTILIILFYKKFKIIVSTNPKWLLIFPLITNKFFELYMGDPFIGDVAKPDSKFYKYLWERSQKLLLKINVFSPFIFRELSKKIDKEKLFFVQRAPIDNLPMMTGTGGLYLGDFSSKDRNIKPLIDAVQTIDINLGIYGSGDMENLLNVNNKCSFHNRVPFSEIKKIIKDYKFLIILLNKMGNQIPGKLYDFIEAPFKVIVIYEEYLDISVLPQPPNYIYCLNKSNLIKDAINELL